MANNNDLAALWSIFKRCQLGEVSALDDLFIIKGGKDIQHRDTTEFHVGFKYDCLSKILTSAKKRYSSEAINVSDNHKKYYSGEYDISDLSEIMYLVVVELFRCELNQDGCATIGGVTSMIPIVDAGTLIKNISFFVDKQLNDRGQRTYLDIDDVVQDIDGDEELSLMDVYSERRWSESTGKSARRWEYADILTWFEKDVGAIYDLFNVDSFAIKAIIKTIIDCSDTFVDVDEGEDKCLVTHERLCEIVKGYTGRDIKKNNVPQCMETMRHRIMDYFLFSLGESYCRMFSRDMMQLCKICDSFRQAEWKSFIKRIKQYEDIIIPIIETIAGKQYDMINLLQNDIDVLSKPPDEVAESICELLLAYLGQLEETQIQANLEKYSICDKYSLKAEMRWNVNLDEKKMSIKIWSHKKIKYPKIIEIVRDDLAVYEGFRNYYICDNQSAVAYCLPKSKRKIIKAKKLKKIA